MESLPSVSCACFLPTHEGWFKFKSRSGNVNSPHSRPNLPLHSKTGFILGVRSGGSESTTLGVATKVRAKTPCRSSSSSSSTASSQLAGGNELDLPRDSGSGTSDRPRKVVSVPGLPHDATPVVSCFWEWKSKFSVHYEKSGVDNIGAPALLLLPGFGVGTFHYEKQLHDLGRDHRVYALDFLGQGKSLPSEDPTRLAIGSSEKSGKRNDDDDDDDDDVWGFGEETEPWADDLVYSMDLWRDQVRSFINQIIGEPVYVVGNSLGGFVALYFAASYPDLVKGVTLLNATPFWGFLPNPVRSPRLAKLFPWSGTFPLPAVVRRLTEFLWEKISDPSSIQEVLKKVYAEHSTDIDKVSDRITEIAKHPAAAASFASIMFAPQGELSFQEALTRCKNVGIPICLMYGKEDPWVRPIWGLHVKWQLPKSPYYVISPAGHCPHDEVPEQRDIGFWQTLMAAVEREWWTAVGAKNDRRWKVGSHDRIVGDFVIDVRCGLERCCSDDGRWLEQGGYGGFLQVHMGWWEFMRADGVVA